MSERRHPFFLVTGGCRSGKSSWAQKQMERLERRGVYLATGQTSNQAADQAVDQEMRERIRLHQEARGEFWRTMETDLPRLPRLGKDLKDLRDTGVLLDCLTLWVSGCMELGLTDQSILNFFDELLDDLWHLPCPVALVSNETGMGVVPPTPLGRRFRDLAGMVNQKAAARATHVILMVSGIPLPVKGSLDW